MPMNCAVCPMCAASLRRWIFGVALAGERGGSVCAARGSSVCSRGRSWLWPGYSPLGPAWESDSETSTRSRSALCCRRKPELLPRRGSAPHCFMPPTIPGSSTSRASRSARAGSGRISPLRGRAETVACLVNFARKRRGLRRLAVASILNGASERKGQAILRCRNFAHNPCGGDWTDVGQVDRVRRAIRREPVPRQRPVRRPAADGGCLAQQYSAP